MRPFPLLIAVQLIVLGTTVFAQSGVFSPQLTVFNNLNSTAGSNGLSLTTGSTPSLYLVRSVGTWSDTWWQWTMGTDNKLRLGFSTVPQLTFRNGAVGIGTDTPSARLDVGGNIALNDNKLILRQGYDVAHYIAGEWDLPGSPTNFGIRIYSGNSPIMLTAGGVNTLYASTSGNVGIGTTNPTHKLAVNGTIKAKEVIVETGWSDYVFADDYALAPLTEVEAHIKEHKHLPGIPSAAQVADHGISVGDMQARFLAKIEELTLHQIAQEKELAVLRAKVVRLETAVP